MITLCVYDNNVFFNVLNNFSNRLVLLIDVYLNFISELHFIMSDQTVSKVNRTNCCVYGCSARADRDKGVSFHFIPKSGSRSVTIVNKLGIKESVDLRKAWDKMLKSGKKLTNTMKVCSKHFMNDDYILPGKYIKIILKYKLVYIITK